MKLSKISFKDDFPEIEGIVLKDLNLLVGKNANGKSTLISIIHTISEILKGDTSAAEIINTSDNFKISLCNSNQKLDYDLERIFAFDEKQSFLKGVQIIKEQLKYNGELKIIRTAKNAWIENYERNKNVINPPNDKLVIQVRRDKKEYPYFEDLISWAENTHFIDFNATKIADFKSESEELKALKRVNRNTDENYRYNNLIAYYYAQLSEPKRTAIKEIINGIGFDIEDILLEEKNGIFPQSLMFVEKNSNHNGIEDSLLSFGMRRTIYLIIYLEHLIEKLSPATVVIDNLGEGLDYERSVNLGKYVFECCKNSNVQLIAASNDNFLLDAIDLEYWTILRREGNKITAINMESHPAIFEKFNFIGLSNFSLLSSDFLDRELQKQELQK